MNERTHPHQQVQRTVRALNRMIAKQVRAAGVKQLATVSQTSPILVVLDGATKTVPASRLTSYAPTVNDRVLVEVFGRQVIVLGTFTT